MAVQMKEPSQQEVAESRVSSRTLDFRADATLRKRAVDEFKLSVQIEVPPGITVLFGASGAGKTTVLNCVAGLLRPDTGHISVGGFVLFDSSKHIDVHVEHRRIGYVFQNLALFPHLTALENVEYGMARIPSADRRFRAMAILEAMRIAQLRNRRPREISGGERQRVALARALVTEPSILLLDEPLSGLDLPTKARLVDDLRLWNEQHRIPVLYVTHDRDEVVSLAERVVVLENGKVLTEGNPNRVFGAPEHKLTAQLAGFENIFDATLVALHEDRGTMTCALGKMRLEVPWSERIARARLKDLILSVGIQAGDILIATVRPSGLSARNIVPGRITRLTTRDRVVVVQVDCGVSVEVHVTLQARDSLGLHEGLNVWLVIKTHSCHLLRRSGLV